MTGNKINKELSVLPLQEVSKIIDCLMSQTSTTEVFTQWKKKKMETNQDVRYFTSQPIPFKMFRERG